MRYPRRIGKGRKAEETEWKSTEVARRADLINFVSRFKLIKKKIHF